ncbi:hypothetical protein [Streptomyces shenzhenensis]|uniref:hypothetical protein n=1 Tax=Streptomyces shenzhenensis TaxID=943815 RepID=UPI001C693905|nr:hypothetical protein [Streptomyces shenzhenensis]
MLTVTQTMDTAEKAGQPPQPFDRHSVDPRVADGGRGGSGAELVRDRACERRVCGTGVVNAELGGQIGGVQADGGF